MNIKKGILWILILIVLGLMIWQPAEPCSAFVMAKGGRLLFGRNFDYFTGVGLLTVNSRNVSKTALVYPGVTPARWTSKFGSITFNQVGRDFPMGGMNEKGLVLECLWLPQTQYPTPDARPAMTELQWIQHMLDTCETAAEVLASDSLVRIFPSTTKLHFLIADRTGAVAVIEYKGGRSILAGPGQVTVPALTNTSYADDLEFLKPYDGFGGKASIAASWKTSSERFAILAAALRSLQSGSAAAGVPEAFALLDAVSYEGPDAQTQWRIVYDPLRSEVHFETRGGAGRRSFRFSDFDFNCGAALKVYDLKSEGTGDVGRTFSASSPETNLAFTRKTFETYWQAGFAKEMVPFVVELIGRQPSTNYCR